MKSLKQLYAKYKEIILYIVFGVLTTAVNFVVYTALIFIGIDTYVTNTVAWVCAVLFAYLTNRSVVFNSSAKKSGAVIKEIISFYGARIFSFVVEMLILYVCIDLLGMDQFIPKLAAQVIVIVLNYILSKFIVFKKPKDHTEQNTEQ